MREGWRVLNRRKSHCLKLAKRFHWVKRLSAQGLGIFSVGRDLEVSFSCFSDAWIGKVFVQTTRVHFLTYTSIGDLSLPKLGSENRLLLSHRTWACALPTLVFDEAFLRFDPDLCSLGDSFVNERPNLIFKYFSSLTYEHWFRFDLRTSY